MDEIIFGTGFGCVTDVVAGPDGLLYVVSLTDGTIYRIVPKSDATQNSASGSTPIQYWPYPAIAAVIVVPIAYLIIRKK